jgi:ABC-type methionine transport system ATPase subunit
MSKQRVRFTFPNALVTEPVIYRLSTEYNIVTNIRRADVQEDVGWVILELEGTQSDIDNGLTWVAELGVRVDLVGGDVIEG